MTHRLIPRADSAAVCAGASLLFSLTGCMVQQPTAPPYPRTTPVVVQAGAAVNFDDDYDYYPSYETYYSRRRREFVYRDGNAWVRRPEPRGVSIEFLFSTPVVRLDFHDAPEQHHSTVVQSYPRNWAPPGSRPDPRDPRRDDRGSMPRSVTQPPPPTVVLHDGYDYYPGYEIYYNRERREYVYREGNNWVHRVEPRDVKPELLLAAPVVRMEFRDAPEQHHEAVVKQYPKNWKRPDGKRDDKDDRNDDRRDRKDDDKRQ